MAFASSSSRIPQKKENIPYEIKNAREWDPNKKDLEYSSSEDTDDDDFWDDYEYGGPNTSTDPNLDDAAGSSQSQPPSPLAHDPGARHQQISDEGFQTVSYKRPIKPQIRAKVSTSRRRLRRINIPFKRDNAAKAAFRKNLPHAGSFTLPKDCHEIEPDRKKMYDLFEEMGVRFGSFIRPPQRIDDRAILIWGSNAQVDITKREIGYWIRRISEMQAKRSTAKDKFSKELSSRGGLYKQLLKKVSKDAEIHRYQREPLVGQVFRCTGSFLWPVDEAKPEDYLGRNFEALDSIRFQHRCHITFDHRLSVFKIFANSIKSVKAIMLRLKCMMQEFVERSIRTYPQYILEALDPSASRKEVVRTPASEPKGTYIPLLTGKVVKTDESKDYSQKANKRVMQNNARIEQVLRRVVPTLPFYRGQVKMRVLFGTFGLVDFYWPPNTDAISYEDFAGNMALANTKGRLIRDLSIKKDATTIMNNVYNATNLFQPISNYTESLSAVPPSYSASFVFQDPEKSPIRLDVEMECGSSDHVFYEKANSFWSRLSGRDNTTPLALFLIRLDSGVSWNLQALAANRVDPTRINPKMAAFADSVVLKKLTARTILTGLKVFDWEKDAPGAMQPTSFEQKTSYRFRLAHSIEWLFEIARYDTFGDVKNPNTPVTTSWGASLWNTNWDETLSKNVGLEIGESARWDAKVETFLPSPDPSSVRSAAMAVADFQATVKPVANFLDRVKKGLPHLRT